MKHLALLLIAACTISACSRNVAESGFVIVNARVIDGSGSPARQVNVRVTGQKIAAVGHFEPEQNDTVIDAKGRVLAPGFVDAHSHHDIDLFDRPDALAAVSQGVTTIVAGQDGGQNFPLADFFARLEANPVAVNVASFAGHGTLRGRVLGTDYRRHATPSELQEMATLLQAEMNAGALGLSSGLEYDPGSFSSTQELHQLASVVASNGGRYISHIRSEDQYFWEAIEEIIGIGREARLPVQVTHIKLAMTRWWGQHQALMQKLNEARASGVDITADIYPYRMWNSNFSWLATLFPERDLSRMDGAEYVLHDMLSPEGILLASYNPQPEYNGMTIADIAELRGSDPEITLMALLREEIDDQGHDAGSQMLGFAMDEPDIEAIMAWQHTVIGSDGELHGVHPRGFGAFARYLGHYVRDRKVLSLEQGVRRISAQSAEQAGIDGRGRIEVGFYADLVIFEPGIIQDQSTAESPHVVSTGIDKVWVNGQLVFDGRGPTGTRPGMPVRRPGTAQSR